MLHYLTRYCYNQAFLPSNRESIMSQKTERLELVAGPNGLSLSVDKADQALLHFLEGAAVLATETSNTADDLTIDTLIAQEGLRRWFLGLFFSVGKQDPSFRTIPNIDESALPQESRQALGRQALNVGGLISFLQKYGPVLWQVYNQFSGSSLPAHSSR